MARTHEHPESEAAETDGLDAQPHGGGTDDDGAHGDDAHGDDAHGDDGGATVARAGAGVEEVAEVETESDKERLKGIMYSERQWVVSAWMKAAFFWGAFGLLGGLVFFGVEKRVTMMRLTMDSVVEPTPIKDARAPDFVLPEGDGRTGVKLDSLRGKWVFINFWATWCPPCRDEMPSMEMLNRRFGDQMEMLAITVDEDWAEVERFFGNTPPSFKVLWDRDKGVATRSYGTRKFPESFLISPEGNVVVKFVGPRDWYNIGTVRYFEEILSGKRNPRS